MSHTGAGSELETAADVPRERAQFKELLLANHFKHLAEPEPELEAGASTPPTGDTTYEQLVCIGYQPQLGQVNAVVALKQSNGYSGGICSSGSTEYVAFYASSDDGATWTALGTTSFTAWDVSGPKPLLFDVSLAVDLPEYCCNQANIVLIRAILSWEVPPSGPTSPIVWGNGLDANVQIAPLTLGTFADLIECLDLPIELAQLSEVVNVEQVIEFAAGQAASPIELHKLYEHKEVPQHRYLLAEVAKVLADPVALAAAAATPEYELVPGLNVNLASIIAALSDPQGDETYEQLGCIGLNTITDALVATIDVKLSSGYSGNLCTPGSYEYVAFWADWGSGWEYVGTTSVNVHDIAQLPNDGLQYAAVLPFAQALTNRQPCTDGPLIVPVRAVLSWATPPSNTDPYAVPVWGGHLEANVLIPPGEPVFGEGGPDLESIGSMPLGLIDQVTGLATGQSIVAFYANDCPFGASITFTGHVINSSGGVGGPGLQYRILVSTNGGATYAPAMTTPFWLETNDWMTATQTSVLQTPDPQGWCNCLENYSAGIDVVGNVLGSYETAGNGQLWIAMEVRQGMTQLGPASPAWTKIQLDNQAPSQPNIWITSGGGSCGDFHPGDLIEGGYSASDNEDLSGVSISVNGMGLPSVIGSKTLTTESGTWSWQTTATTEPCGYSIQADAGDNTIVNSGGIGWHNYGYTGLCLRPAGS